MSDLSKRVEMTGGEGEYGPIGRSLHLLESVLGGASGRVVEERNGRWYLKQAVVRNREECARTLALMGLNERQTNNYLF